MQRGKPTGFSCWYLTVDGRLPLIHARWRSRESNRVSALYSAFAGLLLTDVHSGLRMPGEGSEPRKE